VSSPVPFHGHFRMANYSAPPWVFLIAFLSILFLVVFGLVGACYLFLVLAMAYAKFGLFTCECCRLWLVAVRASCLCALGNQPVKPVGSALATACLLLAALCQLASCLHLVLALSLELQCLASIPVGSLDILSLSVLLSLVTFCSLLGG